MSSIAQSELMSSHPEVKKFMKEGRTAITSSSTITSVNTLRLPSSISGQSLDDHSRTGSMNGSGLDQGGKYHLIFNLLIYYIVSSNFKTKNHFFFKFKSKFIKNGIKSRTISFIFNFWNPSTTLIFIYLFRNSIFRCFRQAIRNNIPIVYI